MKSKHTFDNSTLNTLIGEDSKFIGTLHTQRSCRIEGGFEGELNSQGEVYIGEKSHVKANIYAKRVIIAGEVVGNIETTGTLQILKTGKVYGSISGEQLHIEEGAIYQGQVNMDVISSQNIFQGDVQLLKNT